MGKCKMKLIKLTFLSQKLGRILPIVAVMAGLESDSEGLYGTTYVTCGMEWLTSFVLVGRSVGKGVAHGFY